MKSIYNDLSWSFLVASPSFSGPFFEEAVILLLEDNEDGSFGVIVNKPTGKTLGELGSEFENELACVEVFDGGPVSPEHVSLAICSESGKNEGAFSFGVPPEKVLEILKKDSTAKIAAFAGYTGWGPNQLQGEINEGTWIVSNADIDAMLSLSSKELWKHAILKEMKQFEGLQEPENPPELN